MKPERPNMPKNEELQEQTHLIRTVEAALQVDVPDTEEMQFRSSLLNYAQSVLATLKPAFLVRLYEAACAVKFPSEHVTGFRHALQRQLGTHLNLRAFRATPAKKGGAA